MGGWGGGERGGGRRGRKGEGKEKREGEGGQEGTVSRKRVNAVQLVVGLGFDSAMKDADRDVQWPAFLNEVWRPGSTRADCTVIECCEFIEKKLPSSGSTQHACE